MKLENILRSTGIRVPEDLAELDITSIHEDSRLVAPGTLFVAVRGFSTDGHLFIEQALGKGASAVISEEALEGDARILLNPGGDNRLILSAISAEFYRKPWNELSVFGITGTNGKTSTARMLRWILEKNGMQTGLMGTVGHLVGGREVPAVMTTPGALEIAGLMRRMVEAGDRCCVMEVSSHALSLGRVESVKFDLTLFTNITQDHLDYHRDMDDYLRCKKHLFDLRKTGGSAVVGTYSEGFPNVEGGVTFGLRECDDYRIEDVDTSLSGISFRLVSKGFSLQARMQVPGKFNVFNAAGALAAAVERGIEPGAAAGALEDFPGVPGRFQPVDLGQDFLVAVDYAHTPDALARVLEQASQLTGNRVIAVFGAGGDRDRAKRPVMGRIAADLADILIVTSDNPRTEDPNMIISQIMNGIGPDDTGRVAVEPDRRAAIRTAVRMAESGDVVVIAGKGHEDYQIIGLVKVHFDDREEAAAALREVLE
ncbi:MAG: UDP-N-acetylmuramoyl-L-alanyl-D-glutamate--2,6-diaminopimelate ligase [Candidatus Fermentibacteraceae bacterium]|nr:UDP-N-acetylmuramoyl-L-alanyl-D-glutamate--2,6-diaminopimelate ligase [Candidatus Fermentibacteraceae bacterium]MBN2609735.1 UDP-N-acetylmuramoyl-L-alanyl-D-glutamate--2,6-diaminopimelate ligase [Candidatus Fermentibacteraceae bacterium]